MTSRHSTLWTGLLLLLSAAFTCSGLAQDPTDFAGDWALKLGNRILIVVALTPTPASGGHFTGSLVRPQHFSMENGAFFSNIKGPVVHCPIVRSNAKGNCLSFTTQNPSDKNDEDDFQLCTSGQGRGSLKIDVPTFEPWPVTKGKGPLVIATDWDSNPMSQQLRSRTNAV